MGDIFPWGVAFQAWGLVGVRAKNKWPTGPKDSSWKDFLRGVPAQHNNGALRLPRWERCAAGSVPQPVTLRRLSQ